MRTIRHLPLCLAAFMVAGCEKDIQTIDAREERDPLVAAGQNYMQQQQWDEAETAFKQAIDNEPRMARPHLDLATIYQQHKVNYIHAIYHYDRYLELRPDTEKAEFINEQKLKVAKALANTLISNSPEVKQVVDEINRLRKDNAALTRELAAAKAAPATAPKPTVAQSVPKPAAQSAGSATASSNQTIYHVVAGDTLSKISTKFYGDPGKYEAIYDANRDTMKNQNDLRIGQTLVIPTLAQ